MATFKYYAINRPDVYPARRKTGQENWIPARPTPAGYYAWGWVEYDQQLPFKTVWEYELLPGDPVERALYGFWLEADRNRETFQALLVDYLSQPTAVINALIKRGDLLAEYALTLRASADRINQFGLP